MKKISILLMLMALFGPLAMNGQTQLLFENFDSMSSISTSYSGTGWYAYNAGSGNNWTLYTPSGSGYTHSGANVARVAYNANYAANCYLVSKPFTVSADMNKLTVSLYQKCSNDNYAETFEVFFVKASNVTTLSAVASATHYSAIASASYTNTDFIERTGFVTSSDLAGQSVRVVVHCTSAKDMAYLYIDDITVTETTSGGGQEQGLTVANGTGTNSEIPFYGFYADDNYQHTQTIYPASELTNMQGGQITKLTYYLSNSLTKNFGSTFEVRFGTATSTSFSTGTTNYLSVSSSAVYSGTLSVDGTTVVFDFSSNPYTYTGGNLVVDVRITALGSGYGSTSFLGESGSINSSIKNRNNTSLPTTTGSATTFMPKTTFTYTVSNTYNLTTSANPSAGGTVTPSGTNTYNGGTSVQVEAVANTGYTFSGWTLDGSSAGSTNPYTLTMNDDHTLVANFTALPQYTITVNATTGGTVSGGGTYYQGAEATLTATANSGYAFAGWQLNGSTVSTANPYTITVNANATYTAVFETLAQHNITVTQATGGTISASSATAYMGDVITLTATPETGYFLAEWIVKDASNNSITVTNDQFTMPNSDVTVTASFTQGFNVTLVQTANGTISADQTTNLHPGDYVTLTATADANCIFKAWYVYKTGSPRDVIAVIEEGNYSWFVMPSSDVTAQAIFVTEEEYNQTVGSGSGSNANLPTNVTKYYSLTQQIYTADEIGHEGRITAIAFKMTSSSSSSRSLNIYMAHTNKTAFSSRTDWEAMGAANLVYSGEVTFQPNSAWTTITLNTPFEYDGTSNLNICVTDNTASTDQSKSFGVYSTNANRAMYVNGNGVYNNSYYYPYSYIISSSSDLSSNTYRGTFFTSNNQIRFTIKVPGSAESLTISPDDINDFSYVEGQGPSQPHKIGIVGVDLHNNVTLTAPTNFEICMTEDGAYSSSLTIPRETGSKGNRTVTTWDFEDDLGDWTVYDVDGDNFNWTHYSYSADPIGHDGSAGLVYSKSYDSNEGALTPNNWLVSPQVTLGGTFSMWAKAIDIGFPYEHFGIYVSTDGNNFTLLGEWTLSSGDWKHFSVDLGNYAEQEGYIGVRHFDCTDMNMILVDDFTLDTDAAITVEMPVVMTLETVFVRMKDNLSAGTYSGTLTASAGTGDNLNGNVSLSGEVIAAYTITLTANPTEAGTVQGAGQYVSNASVLIKARATSPYQFINWTENGEVVSTDADYTITVTGNRTLVANFGFIKHITSFNNSSEGGYNLIASPIGEVAPTNVGNMITPKDENDKNTYDLYGFDPTQTLEWRNYRSTEGGGFNLAAGKGYLYGNLNDVNLTFIGKAYDGNGQVTLTKANPDDPNANPGLDFPDWNLVGNPFAVAAYSSKPYYTMNGTGTAILGVTSNGSVEAMEGIFVKANSNGEVMTFSTTASGKGSNLSLNLTDGGSLIDRAIVSFDEGEQLPKFQLDRNSTKLYIPQDGQDYAIVCSEGMGAMPVNFKAENNGTYSLSFSSENAGFAYLHLIDNMTGRDIDLLQTPSYSFEAKTTDYESRFKLVFATGDNSTSDTFAFFSNGSFVINNDGIATLQVIDITGRILSSETINGCTNVNVNAAPGVYMLRLVNGDNVKVQKVVVK